MTREPKTADVGTVMTASRQGSAVLVDVLIPEHFIRRHIPGAKNACVYQVVFLDTMAGLVPDKATPIIVYGAGEGSHDARVAAEKLIRAGYADVSAFPGGLAAWAEAGHALEGEAAGVFDPPFPAFAPQPRPYTLVPEKSGILWLGRNRNISHYGTLSLSAAEVDFTGPPTGFIEIDMRTIRNLNLAGDPLQTVLEAHLASDDFFFTSVFPLARFTLRRAEPIPGAPATLPNYHVAGELRLRGITRAIEFPAHFQPLDDGLVGLQTALEFDRTQWGAIYGSARFFKHLGMHAVYDIIGVEARVVLR